MSSLATGAEVLPTHPIYAASGPSSSKKSFNDATDGCDQANGLDIERMTSSQAPSLYNEPDAIELAPIGLKYDSATSSAIQSLAASSHHNGVSLTSAGAGDVEGAPSFPIDSSRGDEDANPAISAAQKAVQRRKRMINLATLCFDVFLNGWNDATAGPLLPRIQAYYGVCRTPRRRADVNLTSLADWICHCIFDLCVKCSCKLCLLLHHRDPAMSISSHCVCQSYGVQCEQVQERGFCRQHPALQVKSLGCENWMLRVERARSYVLDPARPGAVPYIEYRNDGDRADHLIRRASLRAHF